MKRCDFYPDFEDNQVLTAKDLNSLKNYLEGQVLRTRNKLIGAGIICGFEVFDPKEAEFCVGISKGAGTTTEGWLITGETEVYAYFKNYKDPSGYKKFLKEDTQFDLWELLDKTDGSADPDAEELKEEFLKGKAVILYLEIRKVDLQTCTGDDCDEKGKRVDLCVKKLLIGAEDLAAIIKDSMSLSSSVDLNESLNGKYTLPDISIRRHCVLLRKFIMDKGPSIKYGDMDKIYRSIIERSLADMQDALKKAYYAYQGILSEEFPENPFEKTEILEKIYKKSIDEGKAGIQYFYDFLKDIIAAYDEFREAAFRVSSVCCLDENIFPRHLMLGKATGTFQECPPSVFRQAFIPAPEIRDGCGERALTLFRRLVAISNSFDLPDPERADIKVTPSLGAAAPLGKRAIPYYYSVKKSLNRHWDYEKLKTCCTDRILSYRVAEYSTPSTPKKIISPLEYSIDEYSFFRFEGHIGKKRDEVVKAFLEKTGEANLPVSIIALRAAEKADGAEVKLKCSRDLDLMYTALRGELVCLLNAEESYFANLKTGGKKDGTKGSVKGVILDHGEGLAGVKISLLYKDPFKKRTVRTSFTDSEGTFSFTDLAPGGYNLAAEYEGLRYEASLQVEEGKQTGIKADIKQFKEDRGARKEPETAATMEDLISMGDGKKEKAMSKAGAGKEAAIKELSDRGDDSVGSIYGNFIRYGSGDFIGYVKDLPWIKAVDTGVIKTAYYPVQVLNKLMAFEDALPEGFEALVYERASGAHDSLMETVTSYIGQIKDDLKDPQYKPDGMEGEILEHLKRIRDACCMEKIKPLADTLKERLKEVSAMTLFGPFARKHPALEHQAGAPRGGTFVVICDEDSIVVADFALPYICSSDCPPFAFVIPSQPVVFKLQKTTFSKKDDKEYVFILTPEGGEVKGPGVKKGEDGLFYFKPSESAAGDVNLVYEINGETYSLKITVIEINPNFTFVISPPGEDWRQRDVAFTPIPEDGSKYEWDFGDGNMTQEKKPAHKFDISAKQDFEVRLAVSKGEFTEEVKQTVKIPVCTAAFVFKVTSVINKIALVEFSAEMEGGQYDWDFDDGTAHDAGQKLLHAFDLSAKQSFNVRLKAAKEGCTDEKAQLVKIETCGAAFKVKLEPPSGNTIAALFSSDMASAETYAWDFGDGNKGHGTNEAKHTYLLKSEAQTLIASLTITKGICTDTVSIKIELPAVSDLTIALEKNVFCRKDDKLYKFMLKTPGGAVNGPGVEAAGGDFFFHPSKDGVKAGTVEFSYTMPDGSSSVLKAEVLDPKADFVVSGITRVSEGMYKVKTENRSKGADKFIWKVNGKAASGEESPVLPIVDTAPGQQVEIMLVAISGECEDAFKEVVAMPIAPPHGEIVMDITHVPVAVSPENPEAVMEAGGKGLKINFEYLRSFKANPSFETMGGDRQAFEKTAAYFEALTGELGDPAKARMYAEGKKDGEITERLGALMELSFNEVKRLEQAPQEQRQFAYNLFLIQLNHLLDISGLQKDIGVNSPLVRLFSGAAEKINALKELVEADPDKRLSRMIRAALAAARNRQVYSAVLKKLMEASQ